MPSLDRFVDGQMNRDEVLKTLRAHKETLSHRFGVTNLALFGSAARDEMSDDSDIDILVGFDRPGTSKAYFGVQFYLEDLLGRPVDLVTETALRAEFRPYVERESIDVEETNDRLSCVWNTTETVNSLPSLFGYFSYFFPMSPL